MNGFNPIIFRGWECNGGNLAWEWSIIPTSENAENSQFFVKDSQIYHVLPAWNSHIELTEYHLTTGQQSKPLTSKITAGWINEERCVLSQQYFVCLVKEQLLVLDLLADKNNIRTKNLNSPANTIKLLQGKDGYIQAGRQVISLESLEVTFENHKDDELFMDSTLIQLSQENKDIKITTENQELTEVTINHIISLQINLLFVIFIKVTDIPDTLDNNLRIIAVKCKSKRDSHLACRFLLSTDDGAITLVQQGNCFVTENYFYPKLYFIFNLR